MENYGTIWVCQDCMLHEANGECGTCHNEGHKRTEMPLKLIKAPFWAAVGMTYDEHDEGCEVYVQSRWPDDYECDCETISFSHSSCDGCGSHLYGERHAMTLFKENRRRKASPKAKQTSN